MANRLQQAWNTLRRVPGGTRVFSKIIGRMAPYTGTIDAHVVELDTGYAKVEMRDRRAVRNHLDCVHAIALANLGEVATGVAVVYSLPEGMRGILKGISMEYLKKGRGTLTAECRTALPEARERQELSVVGEIRDRQGDLVARATALWLVGPEKS